MSAWAQIYGAFCERLQGLGYRPVPEDPEQAAFSQLDGSFAVQAEGVLPAGHSVNGTLDRAHAVRVTLTKVPGTGSRQADHQTLVAAEEDVVTALTSFAWYRGAGLRRVGFEQTRFEQTGDGGLVHQAVITLRAEARITIT